MCENKGITHIWSTKPRSRTKSAICICDFVGGLKLPPSIPTLLMFLPISLYDKASPDGQKPLPFHSVKAFFVINSPLGSYQKRASWEKNAPPSHRIFLPNKKLLHSRIFSSLREFATKIVGGLYCQWFSSDCREHPAKVPSER